MKVKTFSVRYTHTSSHTFTNYTYPYVIKLPESSLKMRLFYVTLMYLWSRSITALFK
jgi:hypothetical protein